MADLTISVSSMTQYYASDSASTSGTGGGNANSSSEAAANAKAMAKSSTPDPGGGTPDNGAGSSRSGSSYQYFGTTYGTVTTTTSITSTSFNQASTPPYSAKAKCVKSRKSTIYQLKLKFTIPSDLTSDLIDKAYLKFTGTKTGSGIFRVIAPASTTEQTSYQKYNNNTVLSSGTYASIESLTSVDITDVLKQCIDKGAGWITLARAVTTVPSPDSQIAISGTPTIEIDYAYTACGAPTTIDFTEVVIPNGTLAISWSGATSGINNAITGYNILYKIGGMPDSTSYDGIADISAPQHETSGSTSFIIPNDAANHGKTFYIMIQTKGSSEAGPDFYSDFTVVYGKVNSLPAAPSVSVDKSRIKSTGSTTITFTVVPGADDDTSQTLSVKYSTSPNGTPQDMPANNQFTISAATTYYFWTYDGLEYSSSYTSKDITKNTAPTITSVTMSAYNNVTYTPSVRDGYVTKINGSAVVTKNSNDVTLFYQWKLEVGTGVNSNFSSYSSTDIASGYTQSTTISFSGIDVTSYGANFNTAYRLCLQITDDIDESAEPLRSTIVFAIPAIPTINTYNQKNSSNCSNTNNVHFEDGIRVIYGDSENINTGTTKQLLYSTSSDFPSDSTEIINLTGNYQQDIDLSSLSRGTPSYYFKVKYTCGSISADATSYIQGSTTLSTNYFTYTRANNLTPIEFIVNGDHEVKPYTSSTISFSFNHNGALDSWDSSQDVSTDSDDIYKIKLKYGSNYYPTSVSSYLTNSNFTINNGIVSGLVDISSISTSAWKTLIGTSTSPNSNYTVSLELTVINSFGAKFTTTANFTANFVEGIISIGTPELRIKTGTSTYTPIPYNSSSPPSGANRYHIFETQTLQVALSGLQCYADQTATIYFLLGETELGRTIINTADWTSPIGTNRNFILSGEKTINYVLPRCTSSEEKNYSVKVTLANNETQTTTGGNLNSCFAMKFDSSAINFQITNSNENQQTWECTNWGGYGTGGNYYSDSYRFISAQVTYSPTINGINGEYTPLGSDATVLKDNTAVQPITIISSTGSISNSLSGITYDLIYFGSIINLILDFQSINGAEPTGTKNHQFSYINQFPYYRATPNLGYGKNFFFLNQNNPKSGRTDQLLEISTTNTRNKIYFGYQYDDTYFEIDETNGNLLINCGSWGSNS